MVGEGEGAIAEKMEMERSEEGRERRWVRGGKENVGRRYDLRPNVPDPPNLVLVQIFYVGDL